MKNTIKALTLVIAIIMLLSFTLTSCKNKPQNEPSAQETSSPAGSETTDVSTAPNGSETSTEPSSATESEDSYIEETDYTEVLDYEGSKTVEYADFIKDKGAGLYDMYSMIN